MTDEKIRKTIKVLKRLTKELAAGKVNPFTVAKEKSKGASRR